MISNVWTGDRRVTQGYGCTDLAVEPFFAGCPSKHFHCGIDVAMPRGTPLFAARSGTVARVSLGLLGIRAGDQTDWYVHIDDATVGRGHRVAEGDLVAHSGARVPSGGSLTGPHLHFEVQAGKLNSPATSLDPEPILTGVTDLTKQEHDALMSLVREIGVPLTHGGVADLLITKENAEATKLDAILAAIINLQTEVEAIKAKVESLPA